MERVLQGAVATAPLSQRPSMSEECDGSGAEELVPDSLGAEEADDFLAEIRKVRRHVVFLRQSVFTILPPASTYLGGGGAKAEAEA